MEINQEFWGNMIIDIQWVDNTGGTFTIQNPNNEKEKITLTCSLETGKGFKWEINGTINGIQIEQLNATAVKIDFAPESALSQFNFIQQANDGNWGDLEEIFVTTSYRRIRNVTVAPNPEHALGWENKELWARWLTDFLQNQIQQAKENTKGQPFIKLNLATSVDITRINPKTDK